MGSPKYLDGKQLEELHAASRTRREKQQIKAHATGFDIELRMPPHAIAAVHVQYRLSRT
jgi:hypothetical protein